MTTRLQTLATGQTAQPKTKRRKKTTSITLDAKRWFNRTCGSTYHSVSILVNGQQVHQVEYAYGYGQQYEWTARAWLKDNGYLKNIEDNESLWRYFDGHGINLKEYNEEGQCIYCERVTTMQPRFKDQCDNSIGKLLAMAMVMRDSLGVVSDAMDRLKATNGPFSVDMESAHTLAKAVHQSAQSVYTCDQD